MLVEKIISFGVLTLLIRNIEGTIDSSREVTRSSDGQTDRKSQPSCCSIDNYHFNSITDALFNITSNVVVNLVNDAMLTSIVILQNLENIKIIGQGNPMVNCNGVGAVKFDSCNNVTIAGVSLERCGYNSSYPGIEFYNSSNIVIDTCSFHSSTRQAVVLTNMIEKVYINNCQFKHNKYHNSHGAAIYYTSSLEQGTQIQLILNNCGFAFNGPTESVVYISGSRNVTSGPRFITLLQNSTFVENQGIPIYITHTSLILKNSISFKNNRATAGGGIYSSASSIRFNNRCNARFHNNTVSTNGGAIYQSNSKVIFRMHAAVMFTNNSAGKAGGAVFSKAASFISFQDESIVTFKANSAAKSKGGAIHSKDNSCISFDGYSKVKFHNNRAMESSGGAVGFTINSYILFSGNSTVLFSKNNAKWGGALIGYLNSNILLNGFSRVTFNENRAVNTGGAVHCNANSDIFFGGHSMAEFDGNVAELRGGGVGFGDNCNNDANAGCLMSFYGNTRVTFSNNTAELGGAIRTGADGWVSFNDDSLIVFNNNMAIRGGVLHVENSSVMLQGDTNVLFDSNSASYGGAIYSVATKMSFDETSRVTFNKNMAKQGGALCIRDSIISFDGHSLVKFSYNTAEVTGGAVDSAINSNITFHGNSEAMFTNNRAIYSSGGAVACNSKSHIFLHKNTAVTFINNIAKDGGAVSILQSTISLAIDSISKFANNTAEGSGGAIHLSDNFTATFHDGSDIIFSNNTAFGHGGAIYSKLTSGHDTEMILNTTDIHFNNNIAQVGDSIYIHIPSSYDEVCLNKSIVSHATSSVYEQYGKYITTPLSKLVLHDPATCISNDHNYCGTYFVNNIMLGQEIMIDACVLNYFNKPAYATAFLVNGNGQDHYINGSSTKVLTACDILQGISVTGNEVKRASNFSMTLTSQNGNQFDLKTISIQLIAELSPCHPGFYYDNSTEKCLCYNDNDIITCSDSTSFIRRGYWFGIVDNQPTTAVCPNNYCNFTCCEASNRIYKLSPVRMNQCSSHRSGTACGSCEEGYTLSFDSEKCVNVNKCTVGQTALVVTLSMVYWMAIVLLVFFITYYHVGIGYLYAITYYYSILDILLSKNLYQSKELFTTIINISSLVKITPQFLGQLCLVRNVSGIDQQFIHYVHPLAVSIIIAIICQSARISHKFSSFISRGIIRTVCFLLLLSYTSVANTSLLLLRSLTFDNVDKAYTYLSPDIEYCHGRHLPYFIVAILCTLVIVLGLPLLLLLEPFLNQKINFTRIKPLLDQFQGCYKDKYRCFAAYYMICRLVIIVIIIADPSNSDLSQLLLVISSAVLAFIPIMLKPYKHKILYIFDGLILQLVVLAALIPLADRVSQQLSTVFIIAIMILPLILFVALELIVHRDTIQAITTKLTAIFRTHNQPLAIVGDNYGGSSMGEISIIIDDSMRKNAIICEM